MEKRPTTRTHEGGEDMAMTTSERLAVIADWARADAEASERRGQVIHASMACMARWLNPDTPEGRVYCWVYNWPHVDADDVQSYIMREVPRGATR